MVKKLEEAGFRVGGKKNTVYTYTSRDVKGPEVGSIVLGKLKPGVDGVTPEGIEAFKDYLEAEKLENKYFI